MSLSDTAAHRLRRRAACRRRHLARPLFSPSSSLLFVDYLCRIHLSYYKYAAEIISPSASVCFSRSAVKTMNQARCAVTLPSGSVVCSLFLINYLLFSAALSTFRQLAIARPCHRSPSPSSVLTSSPSRSHRAFSSIRERGLGSFSRTSISISNPTRRPSTCVTLLSTKPEQHHRHSLMADLVRQWD